MSNLYTGILIGAAVSGQFTSTAKVVNSQLQMIGETAGKLSNQKIKLDSLGRAEADLEKARARAAAAAAAVNDLRRELNAGPPRKDWARDFEAAKAASERAAGSVEKARLQVTKADAAFRAAGGAAGGYAANMQKVGTEIERVQAKQAKLNQYVEAKNSMGEWAASARNSMLGLGLGVAAVSRVIIKPTMDFEDAMLGVAKQVDGARDSSGKLTQVYYDMRSQIQKLGSEIPLSTNELAEMVTAGARMGVAKDELIGFTKTAAKMAEAFEIPAGQLADSMGKIAGLYKIPIPNINELADTINYLDDNAISKGGDIIGFLERTGGVAAGVKVTGQNMAALGSTLLTLGEKTETASTATNAMFQKFAAADKGTKKFKAAMQEIGLSTAKVQKGMQQDATGTILMVMDAIGKLPKEKQLGVMVDLVGLEHSDTLAKLANNTGEFRKQIAMANSESAKGSMDKEFKARLGTASAQFKILQNNLGNLATNIGNAVLPAITSMFTSLSGIVGPIAKFAEENQGLIQTIAGMVSGFVAWKAVGAPIISMIGNIKTAWTVLSMAFAANPVGLILMGLSVAAGAIIANWDTIGPKVSAVWKWVKDTATEAWQSMVSIWGQVTGFFSGIWTQVQTAFQGGIGAVATLLMNWSPMGLIYQAFSAGMGMLGIELPAKFTDLGKMLINGLVGGIASMGSAVKGAITGIADNTIGWFKDKLGIKSPSRVFMGLGQMVGEGAAAGIGSMGAAVGRATAGLGMAASMAFNPALAADIPARSIAPPTAAVAGPAGAATGAAAPITITQTFTFTITQQAGEDADALARKIAEIVKRETQGTRRAALGDWA